MQKKSMQKVPCVHVHCENGCKAWVFLYPVCKYTKTIVDATHLYKQKNRGLHFKGSQCLFFLVAYMKLVEWES